MVLVEAWSMAKPVIAARSPAVSTLVDDGKDGLVVEPSAETLTYALLELLGSDVLRQTMGAAGKEKVERQFAWGRVIQKVRDAYEAALALPPVPAR